MRQCTKEEYKYTGRLVRTFRSRSTVTWQSIDTNEALGDSALFEYVKDLGLVIYYASSKGVQVD